MILTLWRYVRGLLCIFACMLLGQAIASVLPFAFPSSLVGLACLFIALCAGLPLAWLEESGGFILKHMGILFIPVAVGLLAWLEVLQQAWVLIALCVGAGTAVMIVAVGTLYQRLTRL